MNLDDGFVDLAVIRVVNNGRMPVTISNVTLDFGLDKRPWHRHTIGLTPVPVFEGVKDGVSARLELYDTWVKVGSLYLDDTKPNARAISAALEESLDVQFPAADIVAAASRLESTYQGF
jgi:hypothetical protein